LDPELRGQPVGVAGEVCIGGMAVADGYLGRPALTAARFVPDPYGPPGSVLYRTGDRGRLLPDGVIDFLGRLDHQVKIRGFRVELGEVEAALRTHPGVRDAVVVPAADHGALHAHVVPAGSGVDLARRGYLPDRL